MAASLENPSPEPGGRLLPISGSLEEVNAWFYERGWTDGLPIVPPTRARVESMLTGWPGAPGEEIAEVPPLMGVATVRAIAVNAVMAGCAPEYLPVVVAAVSAVTKPRYGLSHRQTTTHPATALIVVNGPLRKRLRINYGSGAVRPRLAGERDDRPRAQALPHQPGGRRSRRGGPRPARPPGQIHLLHRRERGGEPLGALPRRVWVRARGEHGNARVRRVAPLHYGQLQHRAPGAAVRLRGLDGDAGRQQPLLPRASPCSSWPPNTRLT